MPQPYGWGLGDVMAGLDETMIRMAGVLVLAKQGDADALGILREYLALMPLRRSSSVCVAAKIGTVEINSVVLSDKDLICTAMAEHMNLICGLGPRDVIRGLTKCGLKVETTYEADKTARVVIRAQKGKDG